ncbi:ATP-dependent zinc metalloprotease FtsH [Dolosicoccus paucivorans]
MQRPNRNPNNRNFFGRTFTYILMVLALVGLFQFITGNPLTSGNIKEISSSEFLSQLETAPANFEEIEIQIGAGVYDIRGKYANNETVEESDSEFTQIFSPSKEVKGFKTRILGNDDTLKRVTQAAVDNKVKLKTIPESSAGLWLSFIPYLMMMGLMGFFIFSMMQSGGPGGGKGLMNFGRAKSKDVSKQKVKVRFTDVAGAEEEKQELVEVVEFLKDPRKFTKLGARIPAGVLLEGPPGTGKTLLAKAVAGEAGVPFYSISGSEFVEMFVGVGASRVRDLFENAKKNAPAIIFIDEIDAVGRQRGAGMGGGHDEREQTLNQLLVEMDGFEGNEGVIVIAATNRSDVLDPALLRPGRFDRQILVGNPDVKGREAILKVHARNKKLSPMINLKTIAQQTPGFSGADLENLLNEAALIAARFNRKQIEPEDVDEAHDRVIAGVAKENSTMSEQQRRTVAFHEAGHTIIGMVLNDARIVHKVTIVPRGRAGGYAIMLPKEDQFIITKDELMQQVVGLLGGRAAEEIVFGTQSTGASNDFQQATEIVRRMVTEFGMSDLGPVQYESGHSVFLGRDYGQPRAYSDQVAYEIDREIRKIMQEAHDKAHEIIQTHRQQLDTIATKLLEVETLDKREIESLFNTGQMPPKEEVVQEEEAEEPTDYNEAKEESLHHLEEDLEKKSHIEEDKEKMTDSTDESSDLDSSSDPNE